MKFTITQQQFSTAIQSVIKAAPNKPSHPILGNILLKAKGDRLEFTCFDLNLAICTEVEVNVESPGEYTLPSSLLNDLVSRLPVGDITVDINEETNTATLTSQSGEYRIQGIPSSEFPELPSISLTNAGRLILESAQFKEALSGVLFSVSTDESKQTLCGVNIRLSNDGKLTLATTDGHRLSVATINTTQKDSEVEITIPSKTLVEVLKSLKTQKLETFRIEFNDLQIQFELGNTTVMSRVLDGNYPNYPQLFPNAFSRICEVDRVSLLESLERIGALASQLNSVVALEIAPDAINLKVTTQDVGNGTESIPCRYESQSEDENPFTIGFSIKYLVDALKAFSYTDVILSMNGILSPAVIKSYDGDEGLTHLIMPIQIKST